MAIQQHFKCTTGARWTTEVYAGAPIPLVGDRVVKDGYHMTVVRREWDYTPGGTLRSITIHLLPAELTTTKRKRVNNDGAKRDGGDGNVLAEVA